MGALVESGKEKVTESLPFAVSGTLLLLTKQEQNNLPPSDFCGIKEVVNKSVFLGNGFISTLLLQRECMPKCSGKPKTLFDLWTDVRCRISEPWVFWRLKSLASMGDPEKQLKAIYVHVTTEKNWGVCCLMSNKMYCFGNFVFWCDKLYLTVPNHTRDLIFLSFTTLITQFG